MSKFNFKMINHIIQYNLYNLQLSRLYLIKQIHEILLSTYSDDGVRVAMTLDLNAKLKTSH